MNRDECKALALEINAWFNGRIKERIPPKMMCEAFMMLPLSEWLLRNGYPDLTPEYWNKLKSPYHAFDLQAQCEDKVCLFDLKFIRGAKRFSFSTIKADLRHLGRTDYHATHRYCLVSGEVNCFPKNIDGVTGRIITFLANDDWKNITVNPDDIVVEQDGAYLTFICRVVPTERVSCDQQVLNRSSKTQPIS